MASFLASIFKQIIKMFTPEMIASFLAFIRTLSTQLWPFLAVIFGLYIGMWIISGIFEAIWNKRRSHDTSPDQPPRRDLYEDDDDDDMWL